MTDINQNGYVKSESQNGVTTIEFFRPMLLLMPVIMLNQKLSFLNLPEKKHFVQVHPLTNSHK